ncbi:hypothetical protein D3C86_2105710 [compost metagenome]
MAKAGAGLKLQMQGLTVEELRDAVDHVLSRPSFKEAVTNIGKSLREAGGYHQAVEEIFEFMSR